MLHSSQQYNTNILIIGGHGHLGTSIIRMLSSKYTITSPCKSELDWCDSKRVWEFIKYREYDALINLSYSHNALNPIEDVEMNKLITDNICLFSKKVKRIIHIGSFIEESGKNKFDLLTANRIISLSCKDAYEISKYYALRRISRLTNSKCIRIPCCYNSNCYIDKVIEELIDGADCSKIQKISNYPCIDIRDLTRILYLLINNSLAMGITHISSAELISTKDIMKYIEYRRNNLVIQSEEIERNKNEIILKDCNSKTLIKYKSDYTIRNYIDEKLKIAYSVSK